MADSTRGPGRPGRSAGRAGTGKDQGPSKGFKEPRRAGRWLILAGCWLVNLSIWATFFVVTGAYLAPVFGTGWVWIAATATFSLGLPIALAVWLTRPLEGFKKAAWFTGAFLAVPLLLVLGLSAGVPGTTGPRLRRHGKPLFEQIFGPVTQSEVSRIGADLTEWWANRLHRPRVTRRRAAPAPTSPARRRAREREAPQEKRDIFFTGVRRPRPRPLTATAGTGPRSQVRFLRKGGDLMVEAQVTARRRKRLVLIFDTGATLSALTREAARELGLTLPAHPVQVELDTAAGRRSFALGVVRRLRVGRAELEHVTVALCDECAPPGLQGLLGLNFTRHFVVSIDQKRHQLTLQPQRGPLDRIADVEPFLQLTAVQGNVVGDRFVVTGQVRNRGPRTIRKLRLATDLLDTRDRVLHRHETELDRLAPDASRVFRIEGTGHRELVKYRLEPSSARW